MKFGLFKIERVIDLNFNDRLRSLIEDRNLTQKQLAKDLNIAPSTLGGYVQGVSEPDFETLKNLAEYFGVTPDYLLDVRSNKSNNSIEDELLRVFRAMSTEQQILFIEQGKVFARANISRLQKEKQTKSS